MDEVVSSADFWRGRRVFLTGHTGFKGSWLSLWLHRLGARTTGFSLPPETEPNLYSVARVDQVVDSRFGDIRDAASLATAMRASDPEIVIHMAAQALVRRSYDAPVETYATNVMGTINVLEAVRQCPGVKAVVVVTSDKCYDNREWQWGYRESEALGGDDPYSSSKACAELVAHAWRKSFLAGAGVAVATARAGNVIGGGDWAEDRLLPDLVRAIVAGRPVDIRNPDAVRPWQHVLEPLAGYLMLAERLYREGADSPVADAWNFGPADEDAWPVGKVADSVFRLWGQGSRVKTEQGAQPHEARWLKLDASKARQLLGWQPRLRLEQALAMTVDWYRACYENPADSSVIRALMAQQMDIHSS